MNWNAAQGYWDVTVPASSTASQLDMVFTDGAGIWDNNNGQDWNFTVTGGNPPVGFTIDGVLDPTAVELATSGGQRLYMAIDGNDLAQWSGDFGLNGNSDGDSDGADFLAWQRQYSKSGALAASSSATVPEPTTFALALVLSAILVLVVARHGRRDPSTRSRPTF